MAPDHVREVVGEYSRRNWGRWGEDDEAGTLNHLGPGSVLRGVEAVETGETFTLAAPLAAPEGQPRWSGRRGMEQYMTADQGFVESGKLDTGPIGGVGVSEDVVSTPTHEPTHYDALGHVWYDGELYNGFDANTTKGGLDRCGVEHLGEGGVVGRGVLLDVPRYRGVDYLPGGDRIPLEELRACAAEQGTALEDLDVLLVRTGTIEMFYEEGPAAYYEEYRTEREALPDADLPGITYSEELVDWFLDREVAAYGTDTLSFEQSVSGETGTFNPLHPVFLRDLGMAVSEGNLFDDLAAACAADGDHEFLYAAAPLPIHGGTAGPVNPVAIR